ncbi:hypothetical protein JKP88DRAFT_271586 [Tribonema minus]|uniref:Uncharacterized protein n=1 Tax=Tribonema minus TaxID=303371 RepID=A0A835Z898_9STRA|nr:hypothetical protein JKP88DRAFT_271586 [Tribonema minus]
MQSDVKLVKAWSGGAAKSQANGCGHLDASLAREQGVFSRFIFEDQCTGETFTTYIEPLAGLTRHPEALCLDKNADKLGDRGYIVLGQTSETCAHALPSRAAFRAPFARMLVFDLGASTYTTPVGADSQRWFVESYARHGFAVSEYYAWEAGKHDPVAIWAEVPGDLKPHYHWLNIPATPDAESMDNPWNFLRAIATPDDFVAVKLDIDNTPVETAFMEQLFKDPKLQALVDEMFFEHHVNVENMWRYWKTQKEKVYLKDTYSMILQLRQKGIRFHSWP